MHYLHVVSNNYFAEHQNKDILQDGDFAYYYKKVILPGNPLPSVSIPDFLWYTNEIPSGSDFINMVFEKNVQELVAITETYGYPSSQRIRIDVDGKTLMPVVFTTGTNKYENKLKHLFKSEYKVGNMTKGEYDAFKYFISNRKNK